MPLSATKAWLWDYFILAARLLLAYTFISCGHSKLTGGQFGLTATPAALPVGQLAGYSNCRGICSGRSRSGPSSACRK